jgi:hypothetical protein
VGDVLGLGGGVEGNAFGIPLKMSSNSEVVEDGQFVTTSPT